MATADETGKDAGISFKDVDPEDQAIIGRFATALNDILEGLGREIRTERGSDAPIDVGYPINAMMAVIASLLARSGLDAPQRALVWEKLAERCVNERELAKQESAIARENERAALLARHRVN